MHESYDPRGERRNSVAEAYYGYAGQFFSLLNNGDKNKWTVFVNRYLYRDPERKYNHFIGMHGDGHYDAMMGSLLRMCENANDYNMYAFFPAEGWLAKTCLSEHHCGEPTIVPIAATQINQRIRFISDKEQTQLMNCPGVFHYYRIDRPVKIESDKPYIAGKPIRLAHDAGRKRLVLVIFHDALSQYDLSNTCLEHMPYTKEFFSKGTIFTNAFSAAEWTHPSVAGLFTGLYTSNHHVVNRSSANRFPDHVETISESFSRRGYFTAGISSSVGISPYLGGTRGFDKVITKSCMGVSDISLIDEAIEHIEAFSETDQFVFLSLFSLHHQSENTDSGSMSLDLNVQTSVGFEKNLDRLSTDKKSVRKQYHEPSVERYRITQRVADRRLKPLYDFIAENYDEDEYVVCLVSDHGASFLEDNDFLLKKGVTNSVLMLQGSGVPEIESQEYINHINYFAILQKLAGIDHGAEHDCCLPKTFGGHGRPYAYSESIYCGQTYKAVIRDGVYEYFFESKALTRDDGSIDLSEGYTMEIVDIKTSEVVEEDALYEKLEAIVYEHVKECMVYA